MVASAALFREDCLDVVKVGTEEVSESVARHEQEHVLPGLTVACLDQPPSILTYSTLTCYSIVLS